MDSKKRRIEEENKKAEAEVEKFRRLNVAEKKRKELLRTLRKKGVMKPTKTESELIEKGKIYWRKFRDNRDEFNVDETISEAVDDNRVTQMEKNNAYEAKVLTQRGNNNTYKDKKCYKKCQTIKMVKRLESSQKTQKGDISNNKTQSDINAISIVDK